jgi:sugar phosphate isomerase/epimerase
MARLRECSMKLAIGSGAAFRTAIARHGADDFAQPEHLRKWLVWWAAQGVQGLTFYDTLPDFYSRTDDFWRTIKQAVDDAGLEVAGFNALRKSYFLPELADGDVERTKHCLHVCEILKPSIFDVSANVPFPHQRDDQTMAARTLFRGKYASADDYAMAARHLKWLAKECASLGAELSLELHDDGLQDSADNCLKLIRLIDEPNVGANPDVGNFYRVAYEQDEDWLTQMVKLAPKTNFWEVKNFKRIWVADEKRAYSWSAELDEGDIDFRESAVILWNAGFRGWVANEGGNGDHIRSTLRYLEYMRWILDTWIPAEGELA